MVESKQLINNEPVYKKILLEPNVNQIAYITFIMVFPHVIQIMRDRVRERIRVRDGSARDPKVL